MGGFGPDLGGNLLPKKKAKSSFGTQIKAGPLTQPILDLFFRNGLLFLVHILLAAGRRRSDNFFGFFLLRRTRSIEVYHDLANGTGLLQLVQGLRWAAWHFADLRAPILLQWQRWGRDPEQLIGVWPGGKVGAWPGGWARLDDASGFLGGRRGGREGV